MIWVKWVEGQIRSYLCRDLRKADIMEELISMDEDIDPSTSRLDGMPRGHGLPSSSVERIAEHREEAQDRCKERLLAIEDQANRIEIALNSLRSIERQAIEYAYMSLTINYDRDIAKYMGLSPAEFWKVKYQALASMYQSLKGHPVKFNMDKLLKQEERHHTKAMRIDREKPEPTRDYINREKLIPSVFVPWHKLPAFQAFAHLR